MFPLAPPKDVRSGNVQDDSTEQINENAEKTFTSERISSNDEAEANSGELDNKNGSNKEMEHKERVDEERQGRYQAMGLSWEYRRDIGYKVKAILDEGRLKYLRSKGMNANRVKFIEKTFTPENYAIVAVASERSK